MAFTHPDYTIVRELGRGGSATVFLAVHNRLNRRVALKVLHGALAADPRLGQRFLREARIVAKLSHPHIVPVHDVGEAPDGSYYMAMEYLGRGTLKARLPEITLGQALATLVQITDALGYAHEHGVVHRDVKPDNILFRTADEALLADFGIARTTASLTHMTMTGTLLGTPDYMSPEQVGGGEVDARSDLYSLGVVLYEVLTGHRPFVGDSVMSTGLAHITTLPPPLPSIVQGFQACLDRALAKRPEDRYQNAGDFRAALTGLERDPPLPLKTPLVELHSNQAPLRRPVTTLSGYQAPRSRRGLWPIPVAVAAAVIAFGGWWLGGDRRVRTGAEAVEAPVSAAPLPTKPSELDRTLAAADAAFRLDRWFGPEPDTAVNAFREALRLAPGHDTARTRLEAIFETTFARAEDAIAAGSFERAESYLAQLEDAWPDDGRIADLAGNLAQARERASQRVARADRERRVGALLARASAAASAGRWTTPEQDSALGYYRQVLDVDPDNVLAVAGLDAVTAALLNRAERAATAGDFDLAITHLDEARGIAPHHPRLPRASAVLEEARQAHAQRLDAAAAARKLAAEISRMTARVNAWLGDEAAALDDTYRQLRADLTALLERAPEDPALRSLQAATERHASALARAAQDGPSTEADDDVFRLPSF